jgi:VanZ family protein
MIDRIKNHTKLRIGIIVFSWFLVFVCMVAIFRLSSQSGEESKELSEDILSKIINAIGYIIGHNTLRKAAHAAEYFILTVLSYNAFTLTFLKPRPVCTYLLCFAYSLTDEIHQYFVPGRACRVFDIFVDSLGSITAILMCLLFASLVYKKRRGKINEGVQ